MSATLYEHSYDSLSPYVKQLRVSLVLTHRIVSYLKLLRNNLKPVNGLHHQLTINNLDLIEKYYLRIIYSQVTFF